MPNINHPLTHPIDIRSLTMPYPCVSHVLLQFYKYQTHYNNLSLSLSLSSLPDFAIIDASSLAVTQPRLLSMQ